IKASSGQSPPPTILITRANTVSRMGVPSRDSDSLVDLFSRRSPKSRSYHERASKVMPSGSNRAVLFYRPYPVYSKRAKGSRIWDVDGVERIDYCFNYSSLV